MTAPTAILDSEAYLRDFHDRRPGATSRCFGRTAARRLDSEFTSPYACLADIVPDTPGPLVVLDVACGDGFLLEQLASRRQPGCRLMGIDMSAGELAGARARLGPQAELVQGRAQSLAWADGSVDVVLCHMALMLMDDVEQVIAEIRRVLRPGGRFSAIVGGRGLGGAAFERWLGLVKAAIAQDGASPVRLGDARTRSAEGLRVLLEGRFTEVEVHDVEVDCDGTVHEVWDWFAHTYDVDRLSTAAQERMRLAFVCAVAPLADASGNVACTNMLRQVVATAA